MDEKKADREICYLSSGESELCRRAERRSKQYSEGVVGHALHDSEVIAEVEVVHGFTKKAKKVETGSVWTDSTPSLILCPPQVTDVSPYEQ